MADTTKLEAGASNFHQLLDSEKEFWSPLFQRLYVWEKKELDQLWDDIDAVLDETDRTRFLGALVLQDRSSNLAFAPRSYWIIDGQQRITTVYLLVCGLAAVSQETGNPAFANEIVRRYLLNQRQRTANQPKVRPTNRDLKQFAEVMVQALQQFGPEVLPAFGDENGALTRQYRRIRSELRERFQQNDAEYPARLARVVLEGLQFVEIVLSEDQDPHQIYDSLNNRGVRLGTIDQVRNEVFQRFGTDFKAAESLFNGKWRSFEDGLKDIDSYFFPFALIHRPSTTKGQLFPTLKDFWREMNPEQILEQLQEYVPAFKALTVGEPLELSQELKSAIARLQRMPAPSSTYPFAMRVIHEAIAGSIEQEMAARALRLIESFLVRRAIAGFEPTGLHAVFKELWPQTKGEPEKILSEIETNATIQFPDDKQFAEDIRTKPLYRRKLASYILREYELDLKGGDPLPEGVEMNIDHVMPQTLTPEWLNVISKEDHEKLVDTWANLVPLSGPLNSEKAQKLWGDVRKLFLTETFYKTTKRLADKNETWNKASIESRATELISWATERWPRLP